MIDFAYAEDCVQDWANDAYSDATLGDLLPDGSEGPRLTDEEAGTTFSECWENSAREFLYAYWARIEDSTKERMRNHPDWAAAFAHAEALRNRRII